MTELARQYCLAQTTVTNLLVAHGIALRPRGLTETEVKEAQRLYESGGSLAEVGKQLGQNPGHPACKTLVADRERHVRVVTNYPRGSLSMSRSKTGESGKGCFSPNCTQPQDR
jgi:hypothetical protein